MATDADISREYHEAKAAFGLAVADAVNAHPEWESLPLDVRKAKASIACREEAERLTRAVIAFDEMKLGREDRWIKAHEYVEELREGSLS